MREVKRSVLNYIPGAVVYLYGSVARGESTPDSDYDVIVITPTKLTTTMEDIVYDAVYQLEVTHDVVISLVFLLKRRMAVTCG
jgi:predicted nucleotidyltransferase